MHCRRVARPSWTWALASAVATLGILVPVPASAQEGTWTRLGPEGGEVLALAIHPIDDSIVFAGTNDGVYRSNDSGLTWAPSCTGLGSQTVPTIIINADRPDEMVVMVWLRNELYRSEDGGETWRALAVGEGEPIRMLRSSPAPFTLYAATRSDVFVSTDSGDTWSKKTDVLGEVHDLAVHPSHPERMIAAVAGNGVWASEDGGASWSECGTIVGKSVYHVTFDPFDPDVVYAPENGTLYRSMSGCRGWKAIEQPRLNRYGFLIADPRRPRTVYADTLNGLIVSEDRGESWQEFGPDLDPLWSYDLTISPLDADRMYLAAETLDERRGVFKSADGGSSWEIGVHGLLANSIGTVVVHPTDSTIAYAGANKAHRGNGIFRTRDSGANWSFLDGTEEAGPCVAIDPLAPDTIYTASANGGLLKSTDAGVTWAEVWGGLPGLRIVGIEADHHRPGTLFILVDNDSTRYDVHRSDDGGGTWVQLSLPDGVSVVGIHLHPGTPGVVFATSYYQLFRSSDFGESWVSASDGLDTPPNCWEWACADYHAVTDLNFDPVDPQTLYASTQVGPFRSSNGGLTWEPAGHGITVCCPPAWSDECREHTKSVYLGCEGWPEGLAVDPERSSIVYTATSLGTYRSYNKGDNWNLIVGPDKLNPQAIVARGDGSILGSSDRAGVLRLETSPVPLPRRPTRRLAPSGSNDARIPKAEREALIELYNATGGPGWISQEFWRNEDDTDFNALGTECSWARVHCRDGSVYGLALSGNNLTGAIPTQLADLSKLTFLFLNMNSLTGPIPPELGQLSQLHSLDLQSNHLEGSIPPELGGLSNLVYLILNRNHLGGEIPTELGDLNALYYLWLYENQLSGEIPEHLGDINHLISLRLYGNKLEGAIPKGITNLVWADLLSLEYNALWADDPSVLAFLDSTNSDWYRTQTVAPGNVIADAVTSTSFEARWDAIPFSTGPGRYEVGSPSTFHANGTSGGHKHRRGTAVPSPLPRIYVTGDKTETSLLIDHLQPGTVYQFVVRTVSDPHTYNQNQVISEPSEAVIVQTLP